jgi:hypothetical protein
LFSLFNRSFPAGHAFTYSDYGISNTCSGSPLYSFTLPDINCVQTANDAGTAYYLTLSCSYTSGATPTALQSPLNIVTDSTYVYYAANYADSACTSPMRGTVLQMNACVVNPFPAGNANYMKTFGAFGSGYGAYGFVAVTVFYSDAACSNYVASSSSTSSDMNNCQQTDQGYYRMTGLLPFSTLGCLKPSAGFLVQ